MVLVPLVSLAYVHESATTVSAADASAIAKAQRIDAFEAAAGRASRSSAAAANDRDLPVVTTTSTSTAPPTTARRTVKAAVVTTTTTTVKPKATTTTSTTVKATTTTAKSAPTTTTTAKPAPTITTTAPAATTAAATTSGHDEGGASYHDYADARTCAHRTLPFGTVVKVTNLANGKSTTCIVNDRGPYVDGRVLDLSRTGFSAIASISDGVIRVAIDW